MSTTIQETTQLPEIKVASPAEEHRRDVFLRAAEIMEREGYETGCKAMATTGPVCLLGAVGRALGGDAIIDEPLVEYEYGPKGPREVVISEESYDYKITGAFVLNCSADEFEYSDDGISDVYGYSDRAGKERVVRTLRAMANGKHFAEARAENDD